MDHLAGGTAAQVTAGATAAGAGTATTAAHPLMAGTAVRFGTTTDRNGDHNVVEEGSDSHQRPSWRGWKRGGKKQPARSRLTKKEGQGRREVSNKQ